MRIGINAYEANVSNRVGSNQFAYQILVWLEKLSTDDITVYLPSVPLADLPKEREGWKYVIIPGKLWTLWRLPLALYMEKLRGKTFDVFVSLGHYAPRFCPFPSVIFIMDLAYKHFPHFFKRKDLWQLTEWTKYSAKAAKHIFTISQHTRRDIEKEYHKSEKDVSVVYPGIDPAPKQQLSQRFLHELHVPEKYIVYVGTIQPRKNLIRLVKAFELLAKKKEFEDFHLVVAGKIGWLADEFMKTIQQSPVKRKIHLLGYVTDEQKYALYTYSQASLLLGLYEGFGIPPLEAMSVEAIPVVANTASLPEVVGEAGVLVDPYDIVDIARGIEKVLRYTPTERRAMQEKAKRQLEKFQWRESAQKVLDVLHTKGGKI